MPFHFLRKTVLLLLAIAVFWSILGCQLLHIFTSTSQTSAGNSQQNSSSIKKIYIQSFTGQNINQVQEVFFDTIKEQDVFEFVELLPSSYEELKILRVEVVDYSIWENEEKIITQGNNVDSEKPNNLIIRRNAIVSIKVSLFDAETGQLIIRKLFTQPFQQIYKGKEAIEKRPDKQAELQRLTKILVFKILTTFYHTQKPQEPFAFEQGSGYEWFSSNIQDLGDKRIKKGNRLAQAGDTEKAIWMWKLVIFEPSKEESEEAYLINRAAAYYNLGIIFHQKRDWWFAAKMFSHANRIKQTIKYAQAWGDSMQLWLEEQRGESNKQVKAVTEVEKNRPSETERKSLVIKDSIEKEKEDLIKSLEKNEQLLLKPRELWPMDPYLKNRELERAKQLTQSNEESDLLKTEEEKEQEPQKPDSSRTIQDLIQDLPDNTLDLTK